MYKKRSMMAFVLVFAMLLFLVSCANNTGTTAGPTTTKGTTGTTTGTAADSYLNAEGLPITKDILTITTLYPRRPQHPENFDDMWFNKELTKRTNIKIQYELVEQSGFQEKKNLVLASGEYPDVFFDGISQNDEMNFGRQGIFISLTELIEKYSPNTLELYEKYPDVRKSLTYEDGSIYNMPCFNIVPRDQVWGPGSINVQWLENLGISMPKTLNEFYQALALFKTEDANKNGDPNDEIPLSYPMDGGGFMKTSILSALGVVGNYDTMIDGKYHFVPMLDEYKMYLEFMNKLYTEQLLDKDSFIMSREEYISKVQKMVVGVINTPGGYDYLPNDDDWMQYNALAMMTSDTNNSLIWPGNLRHTRSWGNLVITNKCEYPEAVVRLVDYFYTDEGTLMVRAGPEAGTFDGEGGWKLVEENGKTVSKITWGNFDSFFMFRVFHAPMNMPYVSGDYMNFVMISGDYKNVWRSDQIVNSGRLEVAKIPYPEVALTAEEQEAMTIFVDVENYVKQMEAKFITGEAKITEWNNYIDTLNKMGIQDIIKIKQTAYDRWNAN